MTDVDTQLEHADPARRRRMPGFVLVLAAAALVGGGAVAYAATRGEKPAAGTEPTAATTAVSRSPVAALSEREACIRLNPLLQEVAQIYATFVESDDVPTPENAKRIADGLREIRQVAPADMGPNIGQVVKGIVLLPSGGIGVDFDNWRDARVHLLTRCLNFN